jgi:hypothetical protein
MLHICSIKHISSILKNPQAFIILEQCTPLVVTASIYVTTLLYPMTNKLYYVTVIRLISFHFGNHSNAKV